MTTTLTFELVPPTLGCTPPKTDMSSAASNLANEIRSNGSEAQFDLAGWSSVNAAKLIEEAFSTPIVALSPFRISFIIGAGRLGRTRYDSELGKQISASLRSIGYEEDRGATRGSTHSFKHQHDTDKNLVFLHAFPDFEVPQPDSPTGEGGEMWNGESDMYKPEQLCIACSIGTFQEILDQKLPSWNQRKALQIILKEKASIVSNIEVKLANRETPSDAETSLYNDATDLDEKMASLTKSMKAMVNAGQLTACEKNQVLSQIESRMKGNEHQLSANEKTHLSERYEMVKAIEPITHHLKNEAEICNLAVKLHHVEKLEGIKGRLLSVEETRKLGEKSEWLEQLQVLEQGAVGWFVDKGDVHHRVEQLKKDAISVAAKKWAASEKKKSSSMSEWQTVGQTKGSNKRGSKRH